MFRRLYGNALPARRSLAQLQVAAQGAGGRVLPEHSHSPMRVSGPWAVPARIGDPLKEIQNGMMGHLRPRG